MPAPLRPIVNLLVALAAAGFGGAVALFAAGPAPGPRAAEAIAVAATPVAMNPDDAAADRAGALRFMGGLALSSSARGFGGWSGLAFAPGCGRLLAVSDTGNWLSLRPTFARGRLTGVTDAVMAPVLDAAGRPAPDKMAGDAEALALTPAGALVAYEQDHRIRELPGIDPCNPATLSARAAAETRPPAWAGWEANGGAESLALSPDGALLLAIAERGAGGRHDALLSHGPGGPALRFRLTLPAGFSPTDAQWLDARRALVLGRRFSPLTGAAAVVMLYDLGGLPARAAANAEPLIDAPDTPGGRELARLQPPASIDNMEGLALQRDGERLFLWMLSDDNFNPGQRTLLLRWELSL